MKKLGILVGDKGDWKFFNDIFADLQQHYTPVVYQPKAYNMPLLYGRLNRWAFRNGIRQVLRQSDVAFFEWASELLVEGSHMPKTCKIITRLHSWELYAWAPNVNWDHVDKIILVSEAMREKFNNLYPAHSHKTEVIYNAKPLDKFKPIKRKFQFNLGMLGEINPRKRAYETILMHYELVKQGYNAHLHIAGGHKHAPDIDEYFVATHRIVEKLNLQEQITFYDHVSDPASWLQNIDIFISNSYWEGHQVGLIEAMATGCFCLSHFWDGAEEVLSSEHLFVTANDLREKIIAYARLSDGEKDRRRMELREVAHERYDIKNQLSQFRQAINGLL